MWSHHQSSGEHTRWSWSGLPTLPVLELPSPRSRATMQGRLSSVEPPGLESLLLTHSSSRTRQSSFRSRFSFTSPSCMRSRSASFFKYPPRSSRITLAAWWPNSCHSRASFFTFKRSSSRKQHRSRNSTFSSCRRWLMTFSSLISRRCPCSCLFTSFISRPRWMRAEILSDSSLRSLLTSSSLEHASKSSSDIFDSSLFIISLSLPISNGNLTLQKYLRI